MLIGVVVTVYNIENYVEKCLRSIMNQKYKELEIVVVDDGSTDNSGAVCDRLAAADSRVRIIHQENQGPIIARLIGVKHVEAPYISFVDGDDWLDESFYSDIVERNLIGTVDVVSVGTISYYGVNHWQEIKDGFPEGIYTKHQITNDMIPKIFWDVEKKTYGIDPSLWGKIFKTEMLKKHLVEVSGNKFHYGEDVAVLYPLLCEAESISIIWKGYCYHRQRKNNELAGYFADADYYKKLYILYDYLKKKFEKTPYKEMLIKQLDYFYMYSVSHGRLKYHDLEFEELYMFPFKKLEANKKIVLYGAGRVGHTFYRQLKKTDYCQLVGWVDRDYSIYLSGEIQPVEKVKELEFDFIIVAIASSQTAKCVKKDLEDMGIDESQIIVL